MKDQIADLVTGILSEARVQEVERHLKECAACQDYAQALKGEDALLTEFVADVDTGMTSRQERLFQAIKHSCGYKRTETLSMRRTIVKSPITRIAAAAVIIFVAMICVSQLSESIDGHGMVFADVKQAFLAESWVHLQYDNDTESWYNLTTGDQCHKQLYSWGDSFVYLDRTNNLRQRYTPNRSQHIIEDRGRLYKDNVIPPYEPETAWERIAEPIVEQGGKHHDVQRETDTLDGKAVIRFDIYYVDAMKRIVLTKQLWVDPETKLPIKIWKKLTSQERKDQNREYVEGVFSFPEAGPGSIYDLGVPRDLPVARNYGQAADPAIEEIFEMAKQCYENFPRRCRAVTWENDRESAIMAFWRDGEKFRLDTYFNLAKDKYPQHHLDVPTTVDEILAWAETQPPAAIYLDDEEKFYDHSYHPAFEGLKTPKTRIKRSRRWALPIGANVIEEHWDYCIDRNPGRFAFIDDAPKSLSTYIGIKTESGDIRRDYYIDPEHDHIRVQNIWWKKRDGQWEKEREYIITEMAQLPSGQWYAIKRKLTTYPERGTSGGESNYTIDIKLLEEDEFPPDTFNGEKLMEGADIVTY